MKCYLAIIEHSLGFFETISQLLRILLGIFRHVQEIPCGCYDRNFLREGNGLRGKQLIKLMTKRAKLVRISLPAEESRFESLSDSKHWRIPSTNSMTTGCNGGVSLSAQLHHPNKDHFSTDTSNFTRLIRESSIRFTFKNY